MKILKVVADNFGSYDHFEMDLDAVGLALVYGATGSGKSTIMDMVCWGLYGQTSKGGGASDVISWLDPGRPTKVSITCIGNSTVERIRKASGSGDLLWRNGDGIELRGKDIRDTQHVINRHLGMDADTFLATSYFSEFNATSAFFMANAKARREVFEKLAPLQFPNQLAERITHEKKETKAKHREVNALHCTTSGRLNQLQSHYHEGIRQADLWTKKQNVCIRECRAKKDSFEADKEHRVSGLRSRIEAVIPRGATEGTSERIASVQKEIQNLKDEVCPTCTQKVSSTRLLVLNTELQALQRAVQEERQNQREIKSLQDQLTREQSTVNQYGEMLAVEKAKTNPFTVQNAQTAIKLADAREQLSVLTGELEGLERLLGALDAIYGLCGDLRGLLIETAVKECEDKVNELLSSRFESAFQVKFTAEADNLEVGITKSGYEASYRQLSRGQRRLLSLCFAVTVMEMAANSAGIHMDYLAFDEATDGCDVELKKKAHSLYEDLATRHSTVLVIDHSEAAQEMFDKKFKVVMEEDYSRVYEE